MGRLVIYGTGGFGREIVTAARNCGRELAFISDTPAAGFLGIPLIDREALAPEDEIILAIGSGHTRRKIAESLGRPIGRLIAPTAVIGQDVELGEGAVFCDFTMVTNSARIGRNFQCNIYSYVAHDCVIGDFVTFAPRVCCNGNVHIEDDVYIGTGAVLRQGTPDKPLRIGAGAVVGMGAVVTRDVEAGLTVVGNPARPLVKV
jgi:sugar O-acyltransferase (sialic acid O-acetyltransferase NeuD family)